MGRVFASSNSKMRCPAFASSPRIPKSLCLSLFPRSRWLTSFLLLKHSKQTSLVQWTLICPSCSWCHLRRICTIKVDPDASLTDPCQKSARLQVPCESNCLVIDSSQTLRSSEKAVISGLRPGLGIFHRAQSSSRCEALGCEEPYRQIM